MCIGIGGCYVLFLYALNLPFFIFIFFNSTRRHLAKAACDWHLSLTVTVVLELGVWREGGSLVASVCVRDGKGEGGKLGGGVGWRMKCMKRESQRRREKAEETQEYFRTPRIWSPWEAF